MLINSVNSLIKTQYAYLVCNDAISWKRFQSTSNEPGYIYVENFDFIYNIDVSLVIKVSDFQKKITMCFFKFYHFSRTSIVVSPIMY